MSKSLTTNFRGDNCVTSESNNRVKEEPVSPDDERFGDKNDFDDFEGPCMKKSLSMSDIAALSNYINDLDMQSNRDDVYQRHNGLTPCASDEAIHTTKPQKDQNRELNGPRKLTVPQSPILRCKTRTRTVHIVSHEEKEARELEEIKKYKLKANPIPKSVLQGTSNLPNIPKKPLTVAEPFNLTKTYTKPHFPSPDKVLPCKARPAPKHKITVSAAPNTRLKRAKSEERTDNRKQNHNYLSKLPKSAEMKQIKRKGPLKVVPFSFMARDQVNKKRKEAWVEQQIEEERKQASQFKAQPLPEGVKKQMRHVSPKSSSSTATENKENHVKFEALPASVLYKEPFKPVHTQHTIKPKPFQLTTQKRAAEREIFDQHLKETEIIKKQKEKEKREDEEREKAELRAKLVHHPRPLPAISEPFLPEKSKIPTTVPEAPTFVRKMKKH